MVLETISHFLSRGFISYIPYIISITLLYSLRRYCAGYVCREERNLHNKTFILIVS